MMAHALSTTVRMYRLDELGDCFLISFMEAAQTRHMLIDCGSFRNSGKSIARLNAIVADIQRELGGAKLDVVVGTHQHNDHLSGFVHCEAAFKQMGVEQVWLSWLDDPADALARGIGKQHNHLTATLHAAREQLTASKATASAGFKVLDDVLGFYGAQAAGMPPALPAEAVRILKKLGTNKPQYLRPGDVLSMPGLLQQSVRIYVLGPPRDKAMLHRTLPREGESYDHALTTHSLAAGKFLDALKGHGGDPSSEEKQYPFSTKYKCMAGSKPSAALHAAQQAYQKRGQGWRKIDDDWLQQAESLALFLDSYTNNSSLVLAIELVESEKVLLFAADAQTGNWLSWDSVQWERAGTSVDDLLARTVLYKVGHHGSHNATLRGALEKMNHPDLFALIPVHKQDPNITKLNGWKMPAKKLLTRLRQKTKDRVLQMDGNNPQACDPKRAAKAAWQAAGVSPKQTDLFIEVKL
jgi:beta-lactamase superfamily II metal-dependent hydrolase